MTCYGVDRNVMGNTSHDLVGGAAFTIGAIIVLDIVITLCPTFLESTGLARVLSAMSRV